MKAVGSWITGLVAVEHLGFLALEMFLWTTPFAVRAFGTTPEFAAATTALAANQGLYNGFLAAGMLWGLKIDSGRVKSFFLSCAVVAGVFAAATVKPSILFVQALPAAVGLVLVVLGHRGRGS